ncbi:MAG: MOSC domain-containing protein, partial [Alphaproteobacteria bacterium]|nr:MOSC domain-containing protein [Alphaproteobacteria bacterium]
PLPPSHRAVSLSGMTIALSDIRRYPVKGMSGETLDAVDVIAGEALPHDRRFALAHASSGFNRAEPGWMPKNHFLNLSRDEKLAQLAVHFDPETTTLTVERGGRRVATGNAATSIGRMMLDQFFAGFIASGARGNPKIVETPGTPFADCPERFLSIISTSSLAEVERVARQPVDPLRFRANLTVTGAERWEERDWIGCDLAIGEARFRVEEPIERCAATNVDPNTATRDMNIPMVLERGFGHVEFGVYARVTTPGTIRPGDAITLIR